MTFGKKGCLSLGFTWKIKAIEISHACHTSITKTTITPRSQIINLVDYILQCAIYLQYEHGHHIDHFHLGKYQKSEKEGMFHSSQKEWRMINRSSIQITSNLVTYLFLF